MAAAVEKRMAAKETNGTSKLKDQTGNPRDKAVLWRGTVM